jgi:hypothetical protein
MVSCQKWLKKSKLEGIAPAVMYTSFFLDVVFCIELLSDIFDEIYHSFSFEWA